MNELKPLLSDQRSILDLWELVCWVLVLLGGLGSTTAIACMIGFILAELHPK